MRVTIGLLALFCCLSLVYAAPPDATPAAPAKPAAKPSDKPAAKAPAPPPLDASTRDFDQQHLFIRVTPDWDKGTVLGHVTIRFAPLRPGVQNLRLHCQDTKVTAVRDAAGTELPFTHTHNILNIDWGRALAVEPHTVDIHYLSTPKRGLFFHKPSERHPDRPVFLYSQGQGTDNRRWIPCYDAPDDRVSWDMIVRVPRELTTVSNGVRGETPVEQSATLRADRWTFDSRAPTYLISLVVGTFETVTQEVDGVTLEFNGPKGRRSELTNSLALTAEMMKFFGEYTGQKYPWPRYAQTYVWDFVYGGMENVTATTLNMRALHHAKARPNYRSDGLVAHELAHMWFGDLLTCRTWDHIWLNEGFATYFTDLFFEHKFGKEEFLMRRRRQNQGYMKGTPNVPALKLKRSPRGDTPIELSGGKAYSRGAAVLHMLRKELGDTVFRNAVRHYVARHKDQSVTSEDLRRAVEDIAGRDLKWFWDQWVYGSGYPKLHVTVHRSGKRLLVKQTQPPSGGQGLFRLNLPVSHANTPAKSHRVYRKFHDFRHEQHGGKSWWRAGVGGDVLAEIRIDLSAEQWARCLASDRDFTGRMDAAEALEAYGEVGEPALAMGVQGDASWGVRELCAQILGRLQSPGALNALKGAVRDSDSRVRAAVLQALGGFARDEVGALLMTAITREVHPYVRAAAAESAGRVKARGASDVLAALLREDSHIDVVRSGAIKGLRALGDPQGAMAALRFLDYEWGRGANHTLRKTALDCVTALAPDAAFVHQAIAGLLDDPYHRMRHWAAAACGTYGITAAKPALESMAKNDWHGGAKGAAKKALQALKPKKK